jgi:hypothetical protein
MPGSFSSTVRTSSRYTAVYSSAEDGAEPHAQWRSVREVLRDQLGEEVADLCAVAEAQGTLL